MSLTENHQLAKTLLESFGEFARHSAEMLEIWVQEDEAFIKAGLDSSALGDPVLLPKLIGESHPDLIGKYIFYSIKLNELQIATHDIVKLPTEKKKECAKGFYALAEQVKSIAQAIGT